jgi:hypothetical protein
MATQKTDNDAKRLGGYLKEKWTIGMSRVSSDEVVRAIMKVTSHKLKTPNPKHLARLINATHGNYQSGSTTYDDVNGFIVEELEKHTHSRDWVVVLKTLLTLHSLMNEGSDEVLAKITSHRSAFNTSRMKELADSPDGAQQQGFIHAYARYLEERCVTIAACKFQTRIESDEFLLRYLEISAATAAPITASLLLQLEVMLDVEFRVAALNNHASLEALRLVINDGKRLFVVLTKRVVAMLDEFHTYGRTEKKAWLELFKRFQNAAKKMADLFRRINNNDEVTLGEKLPTLQVMPDAITTQLESFLLDDEVQVTRLDRATVGAGAGGAEAAPAGQTRSKSPDLFKRKPQTSSPHNTAPAAAPVAPANSQSTSSVPAMPTKETAASPNQYQQYGFSTSIHSQQPPPAGAASTSSEDLFSSKSSTQPSAKQQKGHGGADDFFGQPTALAAQQQPQLFQQPAQPQRASPPPPQQKNDGFEALFDKPGGAKPSASASPAGQGPVEFDPFATSPANAGAAPMWGHGTQQQQPYSATSHQQQHQQAPTGTLDFFAAAQPAGGQRQQTQRAPAAAADTTSSQQLDFFASTVQNQNQGAKPRVW